jgi:hypothetical protein
MYFISGGGLLVGSLNSVVHIVIEDFFFFKLLSSTLLHLPPLGFYSFGKCLDWTDEIFNVSFDSQTLYPFDKISFTTRG